MMNAKIMQISAEEYHLDPAPEPSLSRSIAQILITESPLHAWLEHPRLNPEYSVKESGQFNIGSAAHSLFLEGINQAESLDFTDWRTKDARQAREEVYSRGKIPLLTEQFKTVEKMVSVAHKAMEKSKEFGGFTIKNGNPEQTIIWQEGNSWCRVRPDCMNKSGNIIIDYKTTDLKNQSAWMRAIPGNGYDLQSYMYSHGVKILTGHLPEFVFMVQEIKKPFSCYFVTLSESYKVVGEQKFRKALRLWDHCITNGWPDYDQRIHIAEPTSWALMEAEEMAIEAADSKLFDLNAAGAKENFWFGTVKQKEKSKNES